MDSLDSARHMFVFDIVRRVLSFDYEFMFLTKDYRLSRPGFTR